jgi:hypothetical protein
VSDNFNRCGYTAFQCTYISISCYGFWNRRLTHGSNGDEALYVAVAWSDNEQAQKSQYLLTLFLQCRIS